MTDYTEVLVNQGSEDASELFDEFMKVFPEGEVGEILRRAALASLFVNCVDMLSTHPDNEQTLHDEITRTFQRKNRGFIH